MNMMQSKVEIDEAQQDTDVEQSIRQVANDLHRLNQSITKAVEAGATVELLRGSRYHCGTGRWGDQMVPVVRVPETN